MIYAFSLSSSQAATLYVIELLAVLYVPQECFTVFTATTFVTALSHPPQPNSMADCSSHSAALRGYENPLKIKRYSLSICCTLQRLHSSSFHTLHQSPRRRRCLATVIPLLPAAATSPTGRYKSAFPAHTSFVSAVVRPHNASPQLKALSLPVCRNEMKAWLLNPINELVNNQSG